MHGYRATRRRSSTIYSYRLARPPGQELLDNQADEMSRWSGYDRDKVSFKFKRRL